MAAGKRLSIVGSLLGCTRQTLLLCGLQDACHPNPPPPPNPPGEDYEGTTTAKLHGLQASMQAPCLRVRYTVLGSMEQSNRNHGLLGRITFHAIPIPIPILLYWWTVPWVLVRDEEE